MPKRSKSADATYNAFATRFDELGKEFPECRVLLFVGNENSIPERLNRSPGIVFEWPMLERKTCSDEVIRLPEEFWVPASNEIVAKSKSQKVTQQFLAVVSGPDVSMWKKGEPWWDFGTDDLVKLTQEAKTCVNSLSPQTAESIESGENDRKLVWGVFCSLLFDAFWMAAKHHNVIFDTDGGFEYEHHKGVKPNDLIRPTYGVDASERPKPWVISLPGCRCVDFGESIFNVAAKFFRLSPQQVESHVNSTFRVPVARPSIAVTKSKRATPAPKSELIGRFIVKHHDYHAGSCLNYEPMKIADAVKETGIPKATISDYLKRVFVKEGSSLTPHKAYEAACASKHALIDILLMIDQDFKTYNELGDAAGQVVDWKARDMNRE